MLKSGISKKNDARQKVQNHTWSSFTAMTFERLKDIFKEKKKIHHLANISCLTVVGVTRNFSLFLFFCAFLNFLKIICFAFVIEKLIKNKKLLYLDYGKQ